jgi:hypothetical protein
LVAPRRPPRLAEPRVRTTYWWNMRACDVPGGKVYSLAFPMYSPDSRTPHSGWLQECGHRLKLFWPVKLIGTTLGMTLFFIGYLQVLKHPRVAPTVMPVTSIDQWIGFSPAALPLYLSLWIYVSLAPALGNSRRELVDYGVTATILSAIGLGLFFLWPTVVPARDADWSQHPGFAFLQTVDASGNACPSLHVAFAILSAAWIHHTLGKTGAGRWPHISNWLWCLGIIYSTIAVRQHVTYDLVGGAALGVMVVAGRWLLLRRFTSHNSPQTPR